jgi:iron complex outermembrane recepter protein
MKTQTKLITIGRACLALFGLTLLAGIASAQTGSAGSIEGRVLNAATGQYLKNAQVELVSTGQTTTSGDAGVFVFQNVPAGEAKVRITYTGLNPSEETVSVPAGGTARREFELKSAEYGDQVLKLEGFVVSSQREGNAKAIVQQRQALNVQTTLAADAFGDISEGNIGEFLKLLPGVTVDYVDNDVRSVRLRGLSPKYASVSLDGHPVASSGSSNIDTGRQFEFEQVSLATVDIIEINKTPTADMPASGMSGNVNVRSKSALNQKGRQIKYNVNVNVNDYEFTFRKSPGWDDEEHYKALPGGSVEFSDTFLNGRLGVVAAVNHSGSYVEQKVLIAGYTFDRNPLNNESEVPVLNNWNFQDGLKPTFRDAAVLNLDYKVSDSLRFSFNTSYNYYNAPFFNRNWIINANTTGIAFLPDGTLNPASTTFLGDRTVDSQMSTAPAATNTNSTANAAGTNLRKYGATVIASPSVNWKSGNLEFDGSLSYSRSNNAYDSGEEGHFAVVSARMPGVSWTYHLQGETAVKIRQLNTGSSNNTNILDLANYSNNVTANVDRRRSKDQFWTANADLKINLPNFVRPTMLKVGGDTRLNVRNIENFNAQWAIPTAWAAANLGSFQEHYRPDIQKGETVTNIAGNTFLPPSADKWRLYELFTTFNTDPFATTTEAQQPFNAAVGNNMRNKLQNNFDIEEDIWSAYTMATIQLQKNLTLLAGLRYEKTETQGRGFDDIGEANTLIKTPLPVGVTIANWRNDPAYIVTRFGTRRNRTQSYDNLFPSLQLRFEPNRNLVLRGAYFSSILRPDFGAVIGGVSADDTNTTFTIRNTQLEPEIAHNLDARAEYYFEPVGVVSLGVFYKDIKDIQINTITIIDPANLPPELVELGITPAANATMTRRQNGGDAAIWGIEADYSQQLSFLPGILRGFGVFANATYLHPKDIQIFSLTAEDGIAKYTANGGLSFKHGKFDAKISANWVGKRTRGIRHRIPGPALPDRC